MCSLPALEVPLIIPGLKYEVKLRSALCYLQRRRESADSPGSGGPRLV